MGIERRSHLVVVPDPETCELCGGELVHGWDADDPWTCRNCGARTERTS